MSDYGYAASDLDERWESERNYNGFCHDGILTEDADDYFDGNGPKIVFLLKEPSRAFADIRGNVRGSGEFTSRSSWYAKLQNMRINGMTLLVLGTMATLLFCMGCGEEPVTIEWEGSNGEAISNACDTVIQPQ